MRRAWIIGLTIGVLACLLPVVPTSGQTAISRLHGDWTFDKDGGESLECHMRFAVNNESGLHFADRLPDAGAAWKYPGTWEIVHEEEDDMMRGKVTVKVNWHHQPGVEHHVVIVFLDPDRIEMAFNDEPLRIYKRGR